MVVIGKWVAAWPAGETYYFVNYKKFYSGEVSPACLYENSSRHPWVLLRADGPPETPTGPLFQVKGIFLPREGRL